MISIHAPREGGDNKASNQIFDKIKISIHAPREGGDSTADKQNTHSQISIHAPREGGDLAVW